MKKFVFVMLLIFILSGCKNKQVEQFDFNGDPYTFQGLTDQNYDLFTSNDKTIEILYFNEEFLMVFEINEYTYFVNGTYDQYQVMENGIVIVIDGRKTTQQGDLIPRWNDDIKDIIKKYD